jgi:DNA repair protein RadC
MQHRPTEIPLKIEGLSSAELFFAGCFRNVDPDREKLFVAHVDNEARCLHLAQYEGDETGADFPLRQIIADAAIHGSAGIVLAHNHPSGDSRPSPSDCKATRRLAVAVEALDCTILDHLIFAGSDCTSLRRIGLL